MPAPGCAAVGCRASARRRRAFGSRLRDFLYLLRLLLVRTAGLSFNADDGRGQFPDSN